MYKSANRTIITIVVLALLSVTPALATPIAPGLDLWTAVPGDTLGNGSQWDFRTLAIPADFFGPGSDPFVGLILLEGEPIGPGNIDTHLERLDGIDPFNFGDGPQPIDIEIVALSLKSIDPIIVSFNGGASTELWDSYLTIPRAQPLGAMDVDHSQTNGGTFDATIHLLPVFVFSNVANPIDIRVFDYLLEGASPFVFQTSAPQPWTHTILPGDMHAAAGLPAGDFYPGAASPLIFSDPASQSQLVYNSATPEPATLGLLLIGALALLPRRRA